MKQLNDIVNNIVNESFVTKEPTTSEIEIWTKQYRTNTNSQKLYNFVVSELKNKNAQITYYVTLLILCGWYDDKFVINKNPNSRNIGLQLCKLAGVKTTTKNIFFALNNIVGFRDKLEYILEKTYDTENFFDNANIK